MQSVKLHRMKNGKNLNIEELRIFAIEYILHTDVEGVIDMYWLVSQEMRQVKKSLDRKRRIDIIKLLENGCSNSGLEGQRKRKTSLQ